MGRACGEPRARRDAPLLATRGGRGSALGRKYDLLGYQLPCLLLARRVPSARHNHLAVALDDEVYIFGGSAVDGYKNDLYLLQLSAGNAYYDLAQPVYE